MAQQAAKQEAATEAQPQKSKKGLILALVGGLVVLALGGGGAYWYFSQQGSAHDGKPKEEKVVVKEPVFVPLETFTVNLQPDPSDQYLQVDLTLQMEDQAQADLVKLHMPSVRSRILMLLSSKKSSELLSVEGKKSLTSEIVAQVAEPFTPGAKPQKINNVFFTSFVIQ